MWKVRLTAAEERASLYPGPNEVRAPDGVSLTIDEGEFVAIVGHSGSGKSTLMNMLGCLDTPTSGEYILAGKNVAKLTDDQLSDIRNRHIGFIFQGVQPYPQPGRTGKRRAASDLPGHAAGRAAGNRGAEPEPGRAGEPAPPPPGRNVGRPAAAGRHRTGDRSPPPMILADEPTGNLDTASGSDVMAILRELGVEGRTIILITHDNDIAATARRIVRIQDGRIVSDEANVPAK